MNVYVDDTGIIERPVIDMGQTGGLPSGGDVESFIEKKYPGARILERDYDDGFLEVEILHDGTKKELKFNGCDEWVRTEWEISFARASQGCDGCRLERRLYVR